MWLFADIKSVPDVIRHHARVSPERRALTEGPYSVTFGELDQFTSRLAQALVQRGGTESAVVAFIGKNSIPFFDLMFGATKAGCSLLPLNWRLTVAELVPIATDGKPFVVFADKDFVATMEQVRAQCGAKFEIIPLDAPASVHGGLEALAANQSATDPGLPSDPRSTALLMYTSGTTGGAKGVEISHQALNYMRLSEHFEPVFQWRSDDILMMVMPNFHLLGAALPVQALYNGCGVSIMPAMEPGRLIELIRDTRPSIIVLAPTVIQMLLDHPTAKDADFSSLRLVMYAGSPINATLLKRALIEMKCEFMQFYGATESCGALTILRPEQHDLVNDHKLKSCGTPLPLIDLRVVNEVGDELPDGEIGEFQFRTPAMFTGYRNQSELTAKVLKDGWYRTGDAGYRDKNDGLLYLVDRVKDMIVTGGENVYSSEVEQAIQKHPAVAMSAAIGVPDARWGESVMAVVVLKQGAQATVEELTAHCRTLIAGYKVPKTINFVPSLPISPAGKILKRVLREQYWQGHERAVG